RTLPFYPAGVAVIGVELSAGMLQYARQRARGRQLPVLLVRADAQALPIRDECIDVVISILSLCTIPNHRQALAEAYRVLRPGGRLILVEHVRSPHRAIAAVQSLIDPLSTRFACDHLTREPLELMPQCGFRVLDIQRRRLGIVERVVAEKPL
ncbi:MAG: class I SAM-dependent methyltransferase, partial [Thermomicrobium sp.]